MEEKKKQLFDLIGQCELEGVRDLLKSFRTDEERAELINSTIDDGSTILHVAVNKSDTAMIQWILSDEGGRAAGFNKILATAEGKTTALHLAARQEHIEVFAAIVEGCKVENGEREEMVHAVNDSGETVLHIASDCNDIVIVKCLLSGGENRIFNNPVARENYGKTALHLGVFWGEVELCKLLVEGCSVANGEREELMNAADNKGWTIVHYAAFYGCDSIIEWIFSADDGGGLVAGFKREHLFALSRKKQSALHFAARQGFIEFFDFILSHCCSNTSERLRLFLGVDNRGWTIFHHAARFGCSSLIAHVIRKYPEESKMIIDARDHLGMTALHRATAGGLGPESRREWGEKCFQSAVIEAIAALLGEADDDNEEEEEQEGEQETKKRKRVENRATVTANPNTEVKFA